MRRRFIVVFTAAVAAIMMVVVGTASAASVVGTESADVITGTPEGDKLQGLGGGDTISGMGARIDCIAGSTPTKDSIYGGAGDDKLFGSADPSAARSGDETGWDFVYGQDGNDTVVGGRAADYLSGGVGEDTIYDSPNNDSSLDQLSGGDGNDVIMSVNAPASKDEIVDCGPGLDTVYVDNADVVPSDCETVNDSFAEVDFSEPVTVAEALQVAEQTDSSVLTLGSEFMLGGENIGDFYTPETVSDPAAVERAYEDERLASFRDLVGDSGSQDVTAEQRTNIDSQVQDMKSALASGDAGPIAITSVTLGGEAQQFRAISPEGPSASIDGPSAATTASIETLEVVGQSTVAQRTQDDAAATAGDPPVDNTDNDPVTANKGFYTEDPALNDQVASKAGTFYPNRGRTYVGESAIAGKRYVSQRFTWNSNTLGFYDGYEHDFKTENGNGYHYLTGRQTFWCFPKGVYASTSLPASGYRYLDTNIRLDFRCERNQPTYTVGVAKADTIRNDRQYFTYIRTPKGNTGGDRAHLRADLTYRNDPDCYSVFCTFTQRTRWLFDTYAYKNYYPIPSEGYWTE